MNISINISSTARRIIKLSLFALSSYFLSACTDETNVVQSPVATNNDIYASIQIVDNGSDIIEAETQLTHNSPVSDPDTTYIDLVGDDNLWLSKDDTSINDIDVSDAIFTGIKNQHGNLIQFESANDVRQTNYVLFLFEFVYEFGTWYSAKIDKEAEDSGDYTVSLTRNQEASSHSSVTLPSEFKIISNFTNVTRGQPLLVEWQPNASENADVRIAVVTACSESSFAEYKSDALTDTGTFELPSTALDTELLEGSCSVSLSVTKTLAGVLSPQFKGGIIHGIQERRITFTSTAADLLN